MRRYGHTERDHRHSPDDQLSLRNRSSSTRSLPRPLTIQPRHTLSVVVIAQERRQGVARRARSFQRWAPSSARPLPARSSDGRLARRARSSQRWGAHDLCNMNRAKMSAVMIALNMRRSSTRPAAPSARVIMFAIYVRDTPVFVQERMVSAIARLRGVHERRSFISDLSLADETARRSGPSG